MLKLIFYFAQKIRDFFWKHGCVSKCRVFRAFTERLPGRKVAIALRAWFIDKQPENHKLLPVSNACGGIYFVHSTQAKKRDTFLAFPSLIFWRESEFLASQDSISSPLCLWFAWQAWRYAISMMYEEAETLDGFWQNS